ncbi:M15 family metallopeptidase [Lysinibacillus capsici]|uniref:M15 family metallopeptidase n=1 Tax=Lysinibacillus capsici TaxID=2115968 RepID=UPI00272F8603|nr:M15 family metallopeptidase [Lysinibacillus capsici]MDP1394751.1 M15 family metallopeptidase [Lysinibacillus capsici]MDP1415188.1 M15 family metallopeptidase [Lysinibacillus capsici]MDP1431114.1 M15 family metallopeptidase [Lysinibacillus capsici]
MTSVTTTCRDLSELTAAAQTACRLLFQECFKSGIDFIFITETYRSQSRQNYLYEQGRTRPGQKVTWTLKSNHTSRRAWDIAVAPPRNLYDISTLSRVGAIAKKLGIEWGGYWEVGKYDAPHFEIPTSWSMPKGYKLEGQVIVPSNSKLKVQLFVEDKPKEKDDETMRFTNPTTENAVRDYIKQSVDKKLVDKSWLEKFDNGTMTSGDFEGLKIIISQRSN